MNYAPLSPIFDKPTHEHYFITQTLKPKYHELKVRDQLKLHNRFFEILDDFIDYGSFIVELTKRNVIHWHGYVKFREFIGTDEHELLRVAINDELGYMDEITQIKDPHDVFKYMCKTLDKTNKVINYDIKKGIITPKKKKMKKIQWNLGVRHGGLAVDEVNIARPPMPAPPHIVRKKKVTINFRILDSGVNDSDTEIEILNNII